MDRTNRENINIAQTTSMCFLSIIWNGFCIGRTLGHRGPFVGVHIDILGGEGGKDVVAPQFECGVVFRNRRRHSCKETGISPHLLQSVYSKQSETDADRVNKLAIEQLSFRDPTVHNPIYINTIGYNNNNNMTKLLPDDSTVIHMNHYEEEDEKVTLQVLWEYCNNNQQEKPSNSSSSSADSSSRTVVYLHSKGSRPKMIPSAPS